MKVNRSIALIVTGFVAASAVLMGQDSESTEISVCEVSIFWTGLESGERGPIFLSQFRNPKSGQYWHLGLGSFGRGSLEGIYQESPNPNFIVPIEEASTNRLPMMQVGPFTQSRLAIGEFNEPVLIDHVDELREGQILSRDLIGRVNVSFGFANERDDLSPADIKAIEWANLNEIAIECPMDRDSSRSVGQVKINTSGEGEIYFNYQIAVIKTTSQIMHGLTKF